MTTALKSPRGKLLMILAAATALSACGDGFRDSFRSKRDKVTFDGHLYKAKAQQVSRGTRDHFSVTVSRANQSLVGARQAGEYEAFKYCISEYGTSSVDWLIGPEHENIVPVDDKITLEGFCRP
ncbi:hypothetical protein J7413_16495 [Shimia sp. R10_1]|uniref:hypothetical protein n=1 Tax=Shimia sp. R10_1 TaxID=2821095 RepID=UPI001ADB381A|nr:hypothetical protein [Shimia sp. R10_1]MBO9475148.1 hypothetical protein [Shimia sp. R10_1]